MPPNQTLEDNSGRMRRRAMMTPTNYSHPYQRRDQVVVAQPHQTNLEDVCRVLRASQVPLATPLMQPSLLISAGNPLSNSYQQIRTVVHDALLQEVVVIAPPAATTIQNLQRRQLQANAAALEISLGLSVADRVTSAASNISEPIPQNQQLPLTATWGRSSIPISLQSPAAATSAIVTAQTQTSQRIPRSVYSNPIPSLYSGVVERLPLPEKISSTSSPEALDRHHWGSQSTNSKSIEISQEQERKYGDKATSETRKNCNKKWDIMFKRLLCYKESKGDCIVPQNYKDDIQLASWVNKQRVREKELSEDRVRRLNEIGFVWSVYQSTWNTMLESLKRFKSKHNHCRVPRKYEENPQLGKWVDNQRVNLRKGRLSQERRRQLDSIGFEY
mmetsp:Transcript_7284/g.10307  ORF Transcript_7284/g.10307 Transcript_7284/m.10307 type:complete len:388 (+) Transcript_7284:114-1277(+)